MHLKVKSVTECYTAASGLLLWLPLKVVMGWERKKNLVTKIPPQ